MCFQSALVPLRYGAGYDKRPQKGPQSDPLATYLVDYARETNAVVRGLLRAITRPTMILPLPLRAYVSAFTLEVEREKETRQRVCGGTRLGPWAPFTITVSHAPTSV
jgi:hypothetical protein